MRVLITGGTGFIGKALTRALLERGDSVVILSRKPQKVAPQDGVVAVATLDAINGDIDGVVNLSGAPIVGRRWSASRRALLRASRVDFTRNLVGWMAARETPPAVLVSGSAIGYYGTRGDEVLDEEAAPGSGFQHELCGDWEREARAAQTGATRVCLIRTGIVLGAGGGALGKMLPAFRLGLGGPVGNGRQWMSWIHMDDEVGAILHLLDTPSLKGPFNLTAPEPVTNAEFTRTLGEVLHRPTLFRVPATGMKLLLGEASELLVEGQRVVPSKLQSSGYVFAHPSLEMALAHILNS